MHAASSTASIRLRQPLAWRRAAMLGCATALFFAGNARADVLAGAPSPRPAVVVQPAVSPPPQTTSAASPPSRAPSAASPAAVASGNPGAAGAAAATPANAGTANAVQPTADSRAALAAESVAAAERRLSSGDPDDIAPAVGNTGLSNQAITAHEPVPTRPLKPATGRDDASPAGPAAATQPAGAQSASALLASGRAGTQPAMTTAGRDAPASAVESMEIRRAGVAAPQAAGETSAPQGSQLAEVFRVVMALVAVIGLIFGLRWASRRMMALPTNAGNAHLMQVVSRTALSPRQHLMLIKVGRRLLVIGDSGGQLSSLGQIEEPDEVAGILGRMKTSPDVATSTAANGFGSLYRRLAGKFNANQAGDEAEDWSSADADQPTERRTLLARFDPDEVEPPDASVESDGVSVDRSSGVGFSENEAEAAVEAARHDIQALRAKLQQVTRRLTEGDEEPTAAGGRTDRPQADGD